MADVHVKKWQQAVNAVRAKQGKLPIADDGDFGGITLEASLPLLVNDGYVSAHTVARNPPNPPLKKGGNTPNQNLTKPLPWVTEAFKHNGMREIRGVRHNKIIVAMVIALGGWWRDDETPWCGVFVAHCLKVTGRDVPKAWFRAKAYANYGTRLTRPAYGCIGVMSRRGGGHVCIIIGKTQDGRLVVIGGNQNNRVSVAVYPRSRFTGGFVFPSRNGMPSLPYPYRYDLPVYDPQNLTHPVSEA